MSVTIFTPTYNRANLLPRLYDSLLQQTNKNFEWLVVDDGSIDSTEELFREWIIEKRITIRYYKVSNGGKQRAINFAVNKASFEAFFIVDSDDYLISDAIEKVILWFSQIINDSQIAGVVGIKTDCNGNFLSSIPLFNSRKYLEVSYSNRVLYGLEADMAEVYKTSILRKYKFEVWPDEKFTPECVVWDQISLDGYKLRYYNSKIYYCDYQEGGLTRSSYALYFKNLMGCALGLNMKLKIAKKISEKINLILEIIVCCFFKHNYSLLSRIGNKYLLVLLFPLGILLGVYRYFKIKIPFENGKL